MIGVKDILYDNPDMFENTLRTMFGDNPPQKFYRVPNFGGPSFDLLCDDHALSPELKVSYLRRGEGGRERERGGGRDRRERGE